MVHEQQYTLGPHPQPHPYPHSHPFPYALIDGAEDPYDFDLPLRQATFRQACYRYLRLYFRFSGRASRSEYWWPLLALVIASAVGGVTFLVGALVTQVGEDAAVVSFSLMTLSLLVTAATVVLSLGYISLTVRRLHDVDMSGWMLLVVVLVNLFAFIGPVGSLAVGLVNPNPAGRRFDRVTLDDGDLDSYYDALAQDRGHA